MFVFIFINLINFFLFINNKFCQLKVKILVYFLKRYFFREIFQFSFSLAMRNIGTTSSTFCMQYKTVLLLNNISLLILSTYLPIYKQGSYVTQQYKLTW